MSQWRLKNLFAVQKKDKQSCKITQPNSFLMTSVWKIYSFSILSQSQYTPCERKIDGTEYPHPFKGFLISNGEKP